MSTQWLQQHIDELRGEVRALNGQLELIDDQQQRCREQLARADAACQAAETDGLRSAAFAELERWRANLANANEQRHAVAARLDDASGELDKATADLDHSAFLQRHNADPGNASEPDPIETTGHALARADSVVDAEAVKPPDAPASRQIVRTLRRHPRVAAAASLTSATAAGLITLNAVTAPASLSAATAASTASATTTAAGHGHTAALRTALPMPAGVSIAAADLRPPVLVAAAALAHTPDHQRADALIDHLDDLPAQLTPDEQAALLGPTAGRDRAACLDALDRHTPAPSLAGQ